MKYCVYVAFIFICLFCGASTCFASDTTVQINDISEQILAKEIELHKIIVKVHLQNDIATINKRRRQFLWSISNSAATEAGLIDATQLFFSHTKKVSGGANAGQLYPQIIGQEINAGGNVFELGVNINRRLRTRQLGLDPKNSLRQVKSIISLIDDLIIERTALVAKLCQLKTDEETAILILEGRVLQYIRNALLSEYDRVYLKIRREFAWQNSMEVINLARNVIGAVGNQISVRAGYTGNNHLNGLGNILSEISAVGITVRPTVSLLVSKADEGLARRTLKNNLPIPEQDLRNNIFFDLESMKTLVYAYGDKSTFNRLDVLQNECELVLSQKELAEKETDNLHQRISLQMFRNTLYGPTKMCNSMTGIIDGYDTKLNTFQKNRLAAAGNLTYTIGQGFNFCELWRERYMDERENNRLKRQEKTTKQVLQTQLAKLDNFLISTHR